jgi:hypothetical protein
MTAQKPRRSTRDRFLRALFDRRAPELSDRVRRIVVAKSDPRAQLRQLIELQATTASQMRDYLPSFLIGHALPPDLSVRWRTWNRRYEKDWAGVVAACMDAGYLPTSDALITTRLILGMTNGAVQWSASSQQRVCAEQVADSVITLLRLEQPPNRETP